MTMRSTRVGCRAANRPAGIEPQLCVTSDSRARAVLIQDEVHRRLNLGDRLSRQP